MKFEIGAMSVGDMLDRGLKLLWARFGTFYMITFIMLLPILILELLMPELILPDIPQPRDPTNREQVMRALQQMLVILGQLMVAAFFELILILLATAVTLHITAGEFVDKHVGLGQAFGHVFRRVVSLLVSSILAWIIIVVGFFLCFVPAFIFFVWYIFVPQIVVLEGLSGPKALARSVELTEGFRWRIFGMFLLLLLIRIVLGLVAGLLLGTIIPPADEIRGPEGITHIIHSPNYEIFITLAHLIRVVGQSYAVVCWTLFYFDLRIRKEGFDLELMAQRGLAGPALSDTIPVEVVDEEPPADHRNPWPDNPNPPLT